MNQEIKDKWGAALRSGQFHQRTGLLRYAGWDEGGRPYYCCLGVLCELYRRETGHGRWSAMAFVNSSGHSDSSLPPSEVLQWAGIDHAFAVTLAVLNDGSSESPPQTFDQIATVIEAE